MTHTIDLAPDEQSSIIWPLKRLIRCDVVSIASMVDFVSTGSCQVQLDRGNAEFGVVYSLEDSTFIMVQDVKDEPIYFKASWALAVCTRSTGQVDAARKVCVQLFNYQVDLEFEDASDAQTFVGALKALATNALMFYEAPGKTAFMNDGFRITQLPSYCAQPNYALSTVVDPMAEMNKLWKADDISDFVVMAGNKSFNVHRAVLCLRSQFFRNACKPGFRESTTCSIRLEEDVTTIEALLMEIYGVPNYVTGSVFTTFALEPTMKKEATMSTLLSLFVAADKYNLESIKLRAAASFVDRLPFIHDAFVMIELASFILGSVPEQDCGLSATIIRAVQARLPAIMRDPEAKEELTQNALVYMAVLRSFADMIERGALHVM